MEKANKERPRRPRRANNKKSDAYKTSDRFIDAVSSKRFRYADQYTDKYTGGRLRIPKMKIHVKGLVLPFQKEQGPFYWPKLKVSICF